MEISLPRFCSVEVTISDPTSNIPGLAVRVSFQSFFFHVCANLILILFACVCVINKQDYSVHVALPVVFIVVALFSHPELTQSFKLSPWVGGGIFFPGCTFHEDEALGDF